jgi:hypothetical protein
LPPQLRRTVDDEIKRLRAGDGVLYGDMTSEEAHDLESADGRALPLEGALDRSLVHGCQGLHAERGRGRARRRG